MFSLEKIHRQKKREWEMALIIEAILNYFQNHGYKEKKGFQSLEFGCGDGFQIPYLEKISEVTATDIYISEEIKANQVKNFFECSITNTPFDNGYFDLIFSNHVLEHIENLRASFQEMKRIGNDNCLYAFSVPTNIWLLLSIPAQYYNKFSSLMKKVCFSDRDEKSKIYKYSISDRRGQKSVSQERLIKKIIPCGHGTCRGFRDCYSSFRVGSWEKLFLENGFQIARVKPLLLYSASEFPIIPTTRFLAKKGVCSSVLFLLTHT